MLCWSGSAVMSAWIRRPTRRRKAIPVRRANGAGPGSGEELRALGLHDAEQDELGVVLATVPATVAHPVPVIAWIAHVDTSPETSGHDVRPIIHKDYRGGDIQLPGDPAKVIRTAENPELADLIGNTLITSDGTTLLGADDKAGIAVIMEAAAYLLAHPELPHGPIRICFTCDEEIGHGVDHVDLQKLGAIVGYTLDGAGVGQIDVETFSADLATVRIRGVNLHPSIAKGKMINAVARPASSSTLASKQTDARNYRGHARLFASVSH